MLVTVSLHDLPENATMAHVAAKAGAFSSVTQARKNGWDKCIILGTTTLTKKVTVVVVNRPLVEGETGPSVPYRPDLEPGFWSNYEEPKTHLARAIQYPLDSRFADRLVNAYMRDFFENRRKMVDKADPA